MKKKIFKILVGFISLVILTGIIIILRKPGFYIANVHYKGLNYINESQVTSFFKPIDNRHMIIAILKFYSVKNDVRKSYPQISDISFNIKYPNQFNVFIKEKKAEFLFITKQRQYFVSNEGILLNIMPSEPNKLYNADKIVIVKGIVPRFEKKYYIDPELLKKIKPITALLTQYLADKNLQVKFTSDHQIVLIKDDILPIKIGSMAYLEDKFKNLHDFYQYGVQDIENNIQFIDLRLANKVVVKYWSNDEN